GSRIPVPSAGRAGGSRRECAGADSYGNFSGFCGADPGAAGDGPGSVAGGAGADEAAAAGAAEGGGMIAAWMLYATLVGVLAAAAALGAERVCGALGGPVRFVWCAALAVTLVLSGTALLRLQVPNGGGKTVLAELPGKAAEAEAEME